MENDKKLLINREVRQMNNYARDVLLSGLECLSCGLAKAVECLLRGKNVVDLTVHSV